MKLFSKLPAGYSSASITRGEAALWLEDGWLPVGCFISIPVQTIHHTHCHAVSEYRIRPNF
ncbi:MAG: hypothetical protein WCL42_07170 [Chlorobiaceae bacterium]